MIFFWLALFGAAGIYVLVKNIWVLIISFLVLYIMSTVASYLFARWPAKTAIAIVLIVLAAIIAFEFSETYEINSTPVMIYQATDTCMIYDEAHELIHIPKGAIIARYRDPERKSREISVVGNSDMCVWYYDGQINTTTVSINHASDYWITELNYEPNNWNLSEIAEITYKDFQKSNWWGT